MSSVLEKFFIELIIDDGKLNKSIDSAKSKFKKFAKETVSIVGTVMAVMKTYEIFDQFTQGADELIKFSRQIGESLEDINAFEEATIRAGGSADSFRASVEGLSTKIEEAALGQGETASVFAKMGINARNSNGSIKKTSDILLELNRQFQGLSSRKQIEYGKKLGLDKGTIRLIQQSPRDLKAVIDRQRELGLVSEKTAELSEKYRNVISDTQQAFRSLVGVIAERVLPTFIWIQERLTDVIIFFRDNQAFIAGFFITIGLAILKYALPPMLLLAKAVLVAFAPFIGIATLVIGVATAIGIIVDDIIMFFKGGDSYFGTLLPYLKAVFNFFMNTNASFRTMVSMLKTVWGFMKQIASMRWGSWDDFINNMKTIGVNMINNVKEAINKVKDDIKNIVDFISKIWDTMVSNLSSKFKPFLDNVNKVKENIGGLFNNVKGVFGGGNSKNQTNNNTVGVNTININVQEGDPKVIASNIQNELNNTMWSTAGARSY